MDEVVLSSFLIGCTDRREDIAGSEATAGSPQWNVGVNVRLPAEKT
jgi:hypothetical protein